MVKKILSSGMKPNAKDLQRLIFFMKTHYDNGKKKNRHSASGHAYKGISDTLRRKDGHIRNHLCGKKGKPGGKDYVRGLGLLED